MSFNWVLIFSEKGVPSQLAFLGTRLLCKADSHICHMFDYPVKVKRSQRVDIHLGGRIEEVDSVRNPITDSPIEGIHIIAQCACELERILHNTTTQFRAEILIFNAVFVIVWIILDWQHFFLSQADAADILLPFDNFLDNRCSQANLVIAIQKIFKRVTGKSISRTIATSVF